MKTYINIPIVAFLFFAFILSSCKESVQGEGDERVVGVWKFAERVSPMLEKGGISVDESIFIDGDIRGFEFFQDGSCDYKTGYFVDDMYLGTNTSYAIKNDSLRLFNLATATWDSHRVSRILQDTLELQYGDNIFERFVRVEKQAPDKKQSFDQIILSTTGCAGSCTISDIIIGKDGKLFYTETESGKKNKQFIADVDTSLYNQIERAFAGVDIDKLETHYQSEVSDKEDIQILFIRDGRIYKSITDYGHSSPAELQWAYRSLKYTQQQAPLAPFKSTPLYIETPTITMYKGKEVLYLNKAESTYLKYLLTDATPLKIPFVKMFTFHVNTVDGQRHTITTDGRYYEIGKKTYDLGQNFIYNNNLRQRFVAKE